ncbi:hypothetical protein BDW74DRAFT_69057 [Aspergillus multicolor]|uniref:uncharacterized protein n=1 Tax=Aspergillus multicolor TaxID=41759 RepID=UPI003CCDAB66
MRRLVSRNAHPCIESVLPKHRGFMFEIRSCGGLLFVSCYAVIMLCDQRHRSATPITGPEAPGGIQKQCVAWEKQYVWVTSCLKLECKFKGSLRRIRTRGCITIGSQSGSETSPWPTRSRTERGDSQPQAIDLMQGGLCTCSHVEQKRSKINPVEAKGAVATPDATSLAW